MRKPYLFLALTLIAIASCAAFGADQDQSFNPPSTRTVSGTRIGHFKNGPLPIDLSTTTIAALVPNGSGGCNVLAGTGTSSGTFSIPNVPTGLYLLQIGTDYVWTSNTVLDADYFADYRSDIVRANSSTTTTFDLANLHSWQGTDFLELVCPNNLTFEGPFPATLGATTFTGNFPYFGNLSVAAEGDQYYIAQLITENLGGYFFTGLEDTLRQPSLIRPRDRTRPSTASSRLSPAALSLWPTSTAQTSPHKRSQPTPAQYWSTRPSV